MCPHQWGEWLSYDPIVFEMGVTDGYRYHRECSILGCRMQERAENLIVIGKNEVRDWHVAITTSCAK